MPQHTHTLAQQILDFWFCDIDPNGNVPQEMISRWFQKNPDFDQDIKTRFGAYIDDANQGTFDDCLGHAQDELGIIILLDQFPRNIYRGSDKSFAQDPKARSITKQGIETQSYKKLFPIQQLFYLLPLEHSEEIADQNLSVQLYRELADSVNPEDSARFEIFYDYALRHQVVIERFGRFPHRNAVLKRTSTEEEIAFLEETPQGF